MCVNMCVSVRMCASVCVRARVRVNGCACTRANARARAYACVVRVRACAGGRGLHENRLFNKWSDQTDYVTRELLINEVARVYVMRVRARVHGCVRACTGARVREHVRVHGHVRVPARMCVRVHARANAHVHNVRAYAWHMLAKHIFIFCLRERTFFCKSQYSRENIDGFPKPIK